MGDFVANLKRARDTYSLNSDRETTKCTQFSITPAKQLGPRQPTNFRAAALEEQDPMFPRIRLVSRYLSPPDTKAALPDECDVLMITDLLKQVRPPSFQRPSDAGTNFVVLGVVVSRSEVKTGQSGQKYCMILLSDLKYDISLALHGKAYERFWKVQPGTLIAVLNPRLWIQKSIGDSRSLALSIIEPKGLIEIGLAKDLGQCEEMTAQSKLTKRCKNWVDVRRTHVCEFHVEQRSAKSKRPELNSAAARLWDPKHGKSGKRMSFVKGGEVRWKRGLQVDNQEASGDRPMSHAFLPRGGFPDAPIGAVYVGGATKTSNAFEMSISLQQRQRQRERRQLERATDDSLLNKQLVRKPADKRNEQLPPPPAAKQGPQMKKYKAWADRARARDPGADSDSDLEIVP